MISGVLNIDFACLLCFCVSRLFFIYRGRKDIHKFPIIRYFFFPYCLPFNGKVKKDSQMKMTGLN